MNFNETRWEIMCFSNEMFSNHFLNEKHFLFCILLISNCVYGGVTLVHVKNYILMVKQIFISCLLKNNL
jgi:hypothetical protein